MLSKIIIVIHWHSMNIVHGMLAAVKSDTDKSLNLNNQEKIVINKENLCILSETIFKHYLWQLFY